MSKRVKYDIGDIFEIQLDDNGNKGYGRILILAKPSIFVELFEMNPTEESVSLDLLKKSKALMSVWCTDNGFKKGLWNIIGNVPVLGEVVMPDFWTTDAFTDKILLIRGNEKIEINREQIGDLQQAGIYGHEAVRLCYLRQLKKKGLYNERI